MTDRKISFLGIGLMGDPMTRCLLKAGFGVTAWNRTRAKAEALQDAGAEVADSAAEAVADADVVITMLENGAVVTDVIFAQGVAEAMKPGAVLIDMSSIPPSVARDHAARLKERGVEHVDSPVSGGTMGAAAGELAIMAGGDKAVIEGARPVLEAMGRLTPVGPSGAGQLSKLANQAIVAVNIGGVAEALLLAAAGGADPAAVREAIRGGFAESRILAEHGQRMIDRNFVPGGISRIQLKDLDTILNVAREVGLELPLTQNVRDRFARMTNDLDLGEVDHSGLLLELEAMNSPHRVGDAADKVPG